MSHSQIRINLFGGFEVFADGKPALEQLRQSRKTGLFLEYLILRRGRPVPHEELLEALWSDRESRNPATALRTLLHRYRRLVESEGLAALEHSVLTTRGFYQWNAALECCTVDVYAFEKLAQEARQLPAGDEARIPLYRRMVELYRGPLLLSAAQSWIVPRSVYYHELYTECVYGLIDLLKARGDFDGIVSLCRQAMETEQFDERLQFERMMALSQSGRGTEALSQYRSVNEQRGVDLGVTPSEEIRSAYDTVLLAERNAETEIEALRLALDRAGSGAYECEYPVFQGIYQLQRRLSERSATAVFLCLITLTCTGEEAGSAQPEAQMQRLHESVASGLRRGDVFSQYGASQIVALLPAGSYEAGRLAVERVKRMFYREDAPGCMVTYRLRPLQA